MALDEKLRDHQRSLGFILWEPYFFMAVHNSYYIFKLDQQTDLAIPRDTASMATNTQTHTPMLLWHVIDCLRVGNKNTAN